MAKVKIEYIGKDKLYLHQQLGEGELGKKKLRLIMTDGGVKMQVSEEGKRGWDTYGMSWKDISKAFADVISKREKAKK